jgi:hypothetical protein
MLSDEIFVGPTTIKNLIVWMMKIAVYTAETSILELVGWTA